MVRVGVELCPLTGSAATLVPAPATNRRIYSAVLLILTLCACAPRLFAQSLPPATSDDQIGEQPYQSYHGGDIDSVSLTNGTLSLNFPFLSYPQRGKLHLTFNLMYNNQPQHQGQFCSQPPDSECTWFWGYPKGGALPVERGDVYVSWGEQLGLVGQFIPKVTMDGKLISNVIYYSNWSLQMADGSKHPLANTGTVTWTTNAVWCGSSLYQSPDNQCVTANGPFESLDATAWQVNGALNPCLVVSGCFENGLGVGMTAVDSNGVIYANGTQQDPNGNEITSSSTTITDSLGRQIPLPPTFRSTGNTSTSGCPVTSGQPAAATAVLWAPPEFDNGTEPYIFCYASFPQALPPTSGDVCGTPSSVTRLQSIVLPNGQSWQFQYNDIDSTANCPSGPLPQFATLSQITLPTGGTISYTYTYGGAYHSPTCQNYGRWVSTRTVNDSTGAHTWKYSYSGTTVVTDPLNNDVVHTFGVGAGCGALYETQTQYYQGSHTSGTLLKTVNTGYSSAQSLDTSPNSLTNVVPTSIQTVWPGNPTNQISQTKMQYDSGSGFPYLDYEGLNSYSGNSNVVIFGKVVNQQDLDYPSGTSKLRTTITTYAWQSASGASHYSSYLANNLINSPYSVQVLNGTGGQMAYTSYGYDEFTLVGSGVGSSEQHNPALEESYPGNQTSVYRWLNGSTVSQSPCSVSISNSDLSSHKHYYDTGEVAYDIDPCGYQTTYSYSNSYWGGYLTTVTNALSQSTNYVYDPNTGAVTSIEDPNSQTTTKNYDILTRPTSVNYPDGGSTTACYSDTVGSACQTGPPYEVVITKAISSSPAINETSTIVFDGLGRTTQTQLNSDPSGVDYVDTTYDGNGRKYTVSNPHRSSSSPTDGITTYVHDALGRVCVIGQPDGTAVSQSSGCPPTAPTGDVFTQYGAFPCTTVTDEAGHARQSCVDGLGRMTSVLEDPGSSPHLNYLTSYQYSALSDLTMVTQNGSHMRNFSYDSLSHLTSAANPESGTIYYAYDADSNVVTKTAPSPNQPATGTKQVVTTYTYDTLNRLTSKSYADGYTQNPATPGVTYAYDDANISTCPTPISFVGTGPDGPANGIGRRTAMCFNAGNKSWTYDPMGRVAGENERFIGLVPPFNTNVVFTMNGVSTISTNTAYAYYLNGDITEDDAPDWYEYYTDENGAGEVTTVGDEYYNVLLNATYTPTRQLATGLVGWSDGTPEYNGTTISNTYNNRLQPVLVSATTGATPPVSILNLTYNFNLGNDNGNVIQIANGKTSARTQNFVYDPLNRIWQAYTSGTNWGETYSPTSYAAGTAFSASNAGIDAWGNLTNRSSVTGKSSYEGLSCAPANGNNQLTACFTYDAAGNLIQNGTTSYTYDAENRLIATASTSYVYDGDGNRIEKCTEGANAQGVGLPGTCATNATGTFYWLHKDGGTLTESDLGGNFTEVYDRLYGQIAARIDLPAKVVHYYFHDHLNSTSIVTDALGNIENESDYYPYGGEIVISSGDSNRYKFTGKERDTESGLDNFGARYDASSMGRFMTPDPLPWLSWQHGSDRTRSRFEGYIGNPQNFNLYSYVRNNPTTLTDPTGMYICNGSKAQCTQIQAGLDKAKEALKSGDLTKKQSAALQKVVSFYGKAGDANGVVVQFGGTAAGTGGNTASSKVYSANITTITFNSRAFAGLSTLQSAEEEIHEGTHGIDGVARGGRDPANKTEEMATERNAYRTQSYVAEGLGVVSSWGVWDPSWPANQAEGDRNAAVETDARQSTAAWCAAGGNCQ